MLLWSLLMGLGVALVIEGLVFVLAPTRLEDLLRLLASVPVETRRLIGFVAITLGAVLTSVAISLI